MAIEWPLNDCLLTSGSLFIVLPAKSTENQKKCYFCAGIGIIKSIYECVKSIESGSDLALL